MTDPWPAHLARNLKQLRDTRGWTQQRLADAARVPRATVAHLESGSGNPTLAVLSRLSEALQISLDELVGPPRATVRRYRVDELPERSKGGVRVRRVWPDAAPRLEVDRFELAPGAAMSGVPHTPGSLEALACERGVVEVIVGGETWRVEPGEVLSFPGDQRHGYRNPGETVAVAYSVVTPAPRSG